MRWSGALVLAAVSVWALAWPVQAEVSFRHTWDEGLTGSGGYKYSERVAPDRLSIVPDASRKGGMALRVEVRPGDDPIHSSGERAEVSHLTSSNGAGIDENQFSGTKYFAFSVKLDADWKPSGPDINGHGVWSIVLQLHDPNQYEGASPAFAFYAVDRFLVATNAGSIDKGTHVVRHELSDGALRRGHWVDFVVGLTFSSGDHGAVKVWRRDEGGKQFAPVLDQAMPTLQTKGGAVLDHYWKTGLYRGKQPANGVINVLWLGPLARADSFAEAVEAAFQ